MNKESRQVKISKQEYEGLLPLLFLFGVFGFYISGYLEGGLNSLEGFGLSVVITSIIAFGLIFIATYLDFKQESKINQKDQNFIPSNISENSSQTQQILSHEIKTIKSKYLTELDELKSLKYEIRSEFEELEKESYSKLNEISHEYQNLTEDLILRNKELKILMKEKSDRVEGLYKELNQIKELIKNLEDV